MKSKQQDFRTEKYIRYGIRKYSFGAASVAIAAGLMMFLGNGAVSAAEVQGADATAATTTTPVATKESESTIMAEKSEAKASEKVVETKKVDKTALTKKVVELEAKIASAKKADATAIATANEVLTAAKAVLANETAKQADIDAELAKVEALITVVVESDEAGKQVEETAATTAVKPVATTATEKAVEESKKVLEQVTSEAEVTNVLADEAVRRNKVEGANKAAIEAAVVNNKAAIAEAKKVLAADNVTAQQINTQLSRLNESILAVYNDLKKAGIGRDGNFGVALAAEAKELAAPPLTKEEQTNHYKQFQDPVTGKNKNLADLNKQLFYVDWGDEKAVTGLGDKTIKNQRYHLVEGTTWRKELAPGYVVTVKVKKLANILGDPNGVEIKPGSQRAEDIKKAGGDPTKRYNTDVFAYKENFNGYSAIYSYGMTAPGFTSISGDKGLPGKIQSSGDRNNIGITYEITATYKGKPVKPNLFAASAEEAGETEAEVYKTNGTPWKLLTELMDSNVKSSFTANNKGWIKSMLETIYGTYGGWNVKPKAGEQGDKDMMNYIQKLTEAINNRKITTETISEDQTGKANAAADGLGTQTFGPVANSKGKKSTPIVMTRGATEVSTYLLSAGAQAFTIGVLALDEGDAPASYGEALHMISPGRNNDVKHPFIGSEKGDIDEKDPSAPSIPWERDETTDSVDEGPRQLMGNQVKKGENYTLHAANDGTYELEFQADPNGNPKSYVKGWIDFNNNGKFDEDEASDLVEVTKKGVYKLTFKNIPQNVDTTVTRLGMRMRTALNPDDIKNPTGIAYSGEVEDFQIQQTIPPRGEKKETSGKQGEVQHSTVKFTAYGQKEYSFSENNVIDETKKAQIVKPDGSVVADSELDKDGYYAVPGQGKYKVTDDGKDVNVEFIPEAGFVGTADGISIRRTDANGVTTGWGNEGRQIIGGTGEAKDQLELVSEQVQLAGLAAKGSMDGRYIPTVTPKEIVGTPEESTDIQGKPQTKTPKFTIDVDKDGNGTTPDPVTPSAQYPAKLVDPATGKPTDEKTVTVPGEGTYTIDPETGAVTFTPEPQFTGTAKGIDVSLTAPVGQDKNGQPVTATATAKYTPTVTPVKPTATPATSTGVQGETQEGTVSFAPGETTIGGEKKSVPIKANSAVLLDASGNPVAPGTPVDALDPDGNKVGEYTIDPATNKVTFTPTDKTYVGKVQPAKVQAEDENGTKVSTTYTPTIVGVTPTADPAKSVDVQGATQESTVSFEPGKTTIAGEEKTVDIDPSTYTLLGEDSQPATEVPAKDPEGNVIGKYTLKTVDGKAVAVFEPTDKTYSGEVQPVRVQAKDKNGTAVETTYTPLITPVVPTAEPAKSEAIQGETQKGTPTFSPGDTIAPIKENSYKLLDKEGNEVPAGQKTPAYAEDGVTPIGTYSIDPATGEVTFTPTDKSYTGKVTPANVQAEDKNGTKVSTTYTPTIVPATPTADPAKSVDVQGATQTGKPVFQGGTAIVNGEEKTVEIDEDKPAKLVDPKTGDPVDSVTIEGEGIYTVAPDGTVTFKPEPQFTGVAKGVEVVRQDKNGTPVKATYTPEVKPVTPTGTDAVTEDIQGSTQTGKPEFKGGTVTIDGKEKTVEINEEKPAKLVDPKTGDPVDSVTIEGEGIYTVTPDGTVTFTPEKNFTGKGTGVTVQREDKNGTPVTAKYTPVVKPATPTSSDVITTNVQGATQSGTPTFEGGKVTVNGEEKTVEIDETVKATFDDGTTEKKVPGEGTYTIDETGKVTFTPEKTFTGQATGVTVKRVDKNGTPITAKYTPVVVPVTPTSKDSESEGPKGQPQSGTPIFEGGKVTINGKEVPVEIDETVKPTFEDGTTEKKVPGEGTYTIDENGKVTFTPEPDFVGKASGVTVKRVDKNGTPVTAKYTPTVRPDTSHVDKDGNPLSPTEDGTKPSKDIPGYKIVKTEVDEKGNTKHIYEKVKTSHKDKEGNEIPGYPTEDGEQPKKEIPGYRFVETKKLPNGDIEHVYEKVKTSHKDKEGNEIPGYPSEDGEQPKKEIPGYRFVETKKLPNGDIEHVYEKVVAAPQQKPAKQSPATKAAKGLPNTGTEDHSSLAALGLLGVLSGFGLVASKKKED